jgi:hypothetical protein
VVLYSNSGIRTMKGPDPYMIQTLFGDVPFDALVIDATDSEPWYSFAKARAEQAHGDSVSALETLRDIAMAHNIEARYRALAWNLVRQLGGQPPLDGEKEVLGVVLEVGMKAGLDLLATYADHTAFYYNYSGAAVIWMRPDTSLDRSIDRVLEAARAIANVIGPWEKPRRPPPSSGNARLNILTPMGLHFGEGPTQVLTHDPLPGPFFRAATALRAKLTSLPRAKSSHIDPHS